MTITGLRGLPTEVELFPVSTRSSDSEETMRSISALVSESSSRSASPADPSDTEAEKWFRHVDLLAAETIRTLSAIPEKLSYDERTVRTIKDNLRDIAIARRALARISHKISSKGAQDGASDLLSPGREHYQRDKESPGEGKDDAADCADLPREREKWGLADNNSEKSKRTLKTCAHLESAWLSLQDFLSCSKAAYSFARSRSIPITIHPLYKKMLCSLAEGKEVRKGIKLGSGGFGEVTAKSLGDVQLASKKMDVRSALEELFIQLHIPQHRNLCRVVLASSECEIGRRELYYERGAIDLHESLELHSPQKVLSFFPQILEGLHALHSSNIVHNDLKLENVFVFHGDEIKLGDFGLSGFIGDRARGGTFRYYPPERIQTRFLDPAGDIWAFGVMLSTVLTRKFPFSKPGDITKQKFIDTRLDKRFNPSIQGPEWALITRSSEEMGSFDERIGAIDPTGALQEIVRKCLRFDPRERPTAASLLRERAIQALRTTPAPCEDEATLRDAASGGGASCSHKARDSAEGLFGRADDIFEDHL